MTDRNIILVTADSVRADHCGFISENSDTTPNINQIVDDSIIFKTAIAPGPQTPSSVPAINTGTPFAVTNHNVQDYSERISRIKAHIKNHRKISEQFKERGYSTACIEANPWTSKTASFEKGYDQFYDVGGEQRKHVHDRFEGTTIGSYVRELSRWYHNDGWFSTWPRYYDKILSTINDLEEPYFIWIFLMDTHNPYIVNRKDRVESSSLGTYYATVRANNVDNSSSGTNYQTNMPDHVQSLLKKAYRDGIRSIDRFIGDLIDDTSEDDPIVSLYSDHGEGFGEHGRFGHQHVLYEENIHVPWIIYNGETNTTVEKPISLCQVPDVLKACASSERINPHDFTSEYVYSRTEDSSTITVRGEKWKYISSEASEMLFDLENDPREKNDLSGERGEVLEKLSQLAEQRLDFLSEQYIEADTKENKRIHNRLDALGYMG
jgi:arylsulfatase A-like enzyme